MAHRRLAGCALLCAAALSAAPASFLIRFGTDGKADTDWSGSISPAPSRIRAWQFDSGDSLAASAAWKARTVQQRYWDTPYEKSMKGTSNRMKVTVKGVLVDYDSRPPSAIRVSTAHGEFAFTAAGRQLDGRVEVTESPIADALTAGPDADDYPSLLEARDGTVWLAWQAYEKEGDQIYARRFKNGSWTAAEPVAKGNGDYFKTALAQDAAGQVWVIWSAQENGNFDLYGRRWDGSKWGTIERITSAPAADVYHSAVADKAGNVHVAWMSAREGNFDIYVKSWDGKQWSADRKLSTSPANDWEPVLAAAPDGSVTVLWDTYDKGNYDVVMRSLRGGAVQPLANSGAFEARPTAQYDAQGRLWVAWEEGDWNWGKDYGQGIEDNGRGLMVRRQVRVGVLANGRLQQPAGGLAEAIPADFRQAFVGPKLTLDRSGAPRIAFRFRVNTPQGGGGTESARTMWRTGTTWHDGSRWQPMTELPIGYGRIDSGIALLPAMIVWNTDGRPWPFAATRDNDLAWAKLSAVTAGAPAFAPFVPSNEDLRNGHPNEVRDLARVRGYRAAIGGKSYRIVRGDIHRHTDISWDGNRDGSLHDAYRYALDAVGFDYLGVCDHQAGNMVPYNWWMIQKAVDLFTIPGRFAPLYSYERSLPWPNGHRNVLFAERGKPVLEISNAEQRGKEGAGKLYEYLKKFRGLTTSHTSATGAGTDFRDSNEELEPVVEIYQGYRRNYETPGAPRAPAKGEEPSKFEAGYVWNAWAKGIKMGVQSSSDHVSTHISYAALYVDRIDREAILDAIRARRAYAATDNIVVDLRVAGKFMGSGAATGARPKLEARVLGTGPIEMVEVIRNNQVIYTYPGKGSPNARFDFTDTGAPAGERYYYIRVRQKDIQLAWSSPVWVK